LIILIDCLSGLLVYKRGVNLMDYTSSTFEEQNASLFKMKPENLLQIEDLHTFFETEEGTVRAVDGVSLEINHKAALGVVGESGCGKSITALSIMQLIPRPKGRIESGRILFSSENKGLVDIAKVNPTGSEMRSIRGNEIAMIFQEPMTSLNPVFTIGEQIAEAVQLHRNLSKKEAWNVATDMIAKVGIPNPADRVKDFPHHLSGGMRQRAMIAMALSCNPRLLIADEPTTALDVTIQAQIINLMARLQEEYHMSILMITHNLGVVTKMCDQVAVMYMGKVVEQGSVRQIMKETLHPYTSGLIKSIPDIGVRTQRRLTPITGLVPSPFDLPKGCSFGPRCERRFEKCASEPPFLGNDGDHQVRCWLYE
jgi:oligopeptide/dipeptide ABC transporter ATP-binding protein